MKLATDLGVLGFQFDPHLTHRGLELHGLGIGRADQTKGEYQAVKGFHSGAR